MTARAFWSGVWAELNGTGEQRRLAQTVSSRTLNNAAAAVQRRLAGLDPDDAADLALAPGLAVAEELLRRLADATTPTSKEQPR